LSEILPNNVDIVNDGADLPKKQITKRLISIVFDVFTVLVVLFVIFLLVLMFQMKGLTSNGIALGGYRLFLVQTGSMSPEYPTGSVVVTKQKPVEELGVGDVISFIANYSGAVVSHRIVEAEDLKNGTRRFTTKGDANMAADNDKVDGMNVLGVVIFGIPEVGKLLGWLKTIWGLLLLVILPAGLVIIGESVKLAGILREEREKKQVPEKEVDLNGDSDEEDQVPNQEPEELRSNQETVRKSDDGANQDAETQPVDDSPVSSEKSGDAVR